MTDKNYIASYIKSALTEQVLNAPNKVQEASEIEILETLHRAHQKGGNDAAKQAWETILELTPDKAQLLDNPKKRLYHISELNELPSVKWLLPNLIPETALIEIHGAPNAGKSLFALDIAARISLDKPVVYVAAEGLSGYRARCASWAAHNSINPEQLYLFSQSVNLTDFGAVTGFMNEIRHLDPKLITFDTLARCMAGGDENSARDMGILIDNVERIINQLSTSVLLVHHTGKSGGVERGSSSLRGACDSMMLVTQENGTVQIENVKQKDGKPFAPIKKIIIEVGESVVLTDITQEQLESNDLTNNEKTILEMLNQSIYQTSGAAASKIGKECGISGGTLSRTLSSLKDKGYIRQQPREPYYITDAGIAVISSTNQ